MDVRVMDDFLYRVGVSGRETYIKDENGLLIKGFEGLDVNFFRDQIEKNAGLYNCVRRNASNLMELELEERPGSFWGKYQIIIKNTSLGVEVQTNTLSIYFPLLGAIRGLPNEAVAGNMEV